MEKKNFEVNQLIFKESSVISYQWFPEGTSGLQSQGSLRLQHQLAENLQESCRSSRNLMKQIDNADGNLHFIAAQAGTTRPAAARRSYLLTSQQLLTVLSSKINNNSN